MYALPKYFRSMTLYILHYIFTALHLSDSYIIINYFTNKTYIELYNLNYDAL